MPSDPTCSHAVNTERVSTYTMTKTVQTGLPGQPLAVHYLGEVYVPENVARIQTEGPTAYMTEEFATFYTVSLTNGSLTARPSGACDPAHACAQGYADPPIFATATGSHAMGVFSKRHPEGQYVLFNFALGNDANNTTKWTLPFVDTNVAAGTTLKYEVFICVGPLASVVKCMLQLAGSTAAEYANPPNVKVPIPMSVSSLDRV